MGVDAAQASQSALAAAVFAEVGDLDLLVVTHDGEADLTLAVNDDPYLASDFERELGEETGELRGDDLLGGDSPAVDPLQGLDLAGFQTDGIAVYFFDRSPLAKPQPKVALWPVIL
jgi:hypothetical protein